MTHRDEDEEIIDGALDTLAWQRREIDRLKGEVGAEVARISAWLRAAGYNQIAAAIEAGEYKETDNA